MGKLFAMEEKVRGMLRRWAEVLVVGKDLEMTAFATQRVPEIVEKWDPFLGGDVVYVIKSGYVELKLGKPVDESKVFTNRKRRWRYMTLGTGWKEEDDFF